MARGPRPCAMKPTLGTWLTLNVCPPRTAISKASGLRMMVRVLLMIRAELPAERMDAARAARLRNFMMRRRGDGNPTASGRGLDVEKEKESQRSEALGEEEKPLLARLQPGKTEWDEGDENAAAERRGTPFYSISDHSVDSVHAYCYLRSCCFNEQLARGKRSSPFSVKPMPSKPW